MIKVKVKLLSHVRLFVTPWTVAYQAPLSMGFSRQEYAQISSVPVNKFGQMRCCCSVAKSCLTLCDPMNCSSQAPLSITISLSLLKLISFELVILSNHLILCHPLLLLPSIFPSLRVFSNESALHIRWPKYWSFSFSISPSNEYSRLISFRMDCLISLQSKGLSRIFLAPQFKRINSSAVSLLYGPTLTSIHDYWKNYSFD